jgi:sugar phosphate permease
MPSATESLTKRPPRLPFLPVVPFYGWWMLLCMTMLRLVAAGVGNNVNSLLVLPFQKEFGVSRGEVSLMATASSVSIAVMGPLGGWLMDKYGPRRVMLVCLLLTTTGYLMLSQAQTWWQVVVLFTIPIGVGYNWAILNSGAPMLNNWFDRNKARSLSLLNVGHGAGALFLPLMAVVIREFGWRPAVVISGLSLFLVGMVVVLVSRDTPEEMGLTPDGDPLREATSSAPSAAAEGMSLREAVKTPYFWAISLGSAFMLIINISIVFHMVPLLQSRGESEGLGATLLSMQLFLSVPIVLVAAWGADRLEGNKVLLVMMSCTLTGVLVLIVADRPALYVLAMSLLAFGGANWAILWSVLGHAYGRRYYNAIRMSIYSILTGGIALGPLLAGLTFDAKGSYDLWLQILVGIGVLGVATFLVAIPTGRAVTLRRMAARA